MRGTGEPTQHLLIVEGDTEAGVFSRYANQLLDIPVAWANWARVQVGCTINNRLRLARTA